MTPSAPEVGGAVSRMEIGKTFSGGIDGTSSGVFLSCGNPQVGEAGYVAIEVVRGRVGDLEGSFALQQFGMMHAGSQTLSYDVVPGSGSGALEGVTGTLRLNAHDDGTHHYELEYEMGAAP